MRTVIWWWLQTGTVLGPTYTGAEWHTSFTQKLPGSGGLKGEGWILAVLIAGVDMSWAVAGVEIAGALAWIKTAKAQVVVKMARAVAGVEIARALAGVEVNVISLVEKTLY